MNIICPYCASSEVKTVSDPVGDLGWCQQCHRTWPAEQAASDTPHHPLAEERDIGTPSAPGKDP